MLRLSQSKAMGRTVNGNEQGGRGGGEGKVGENGVEDVSTAREEEESRSLLRI